MENERQTANAIKFYESKSHTYDSTWHPSFCTRFLSHLPIHPGQNILDLACGTGLLTFLLADAVGPSGHVTGIDITPGMVSIARAKKSSAGTQYDHVDLVEADIQDLGSVSELMGERFDVITVASALVLFPDPKKAVEHWARWLVPGGVLAVDATHPRNLVSGMVLELTARRLNLPLPYNRAWSQSEQTLRRLLETSGLEVEKVVTIEDQAGYGRRCGTAEKPRHIRFVRPPISDVVPDSRLSYPSRMPTSCAWHVCRSSRGHYSTLAAPEHTFFLFLQSHVTTRTKGRLVWSSEAVSASDRHQWEHFGLCNPASRAISMYYRIQFQYHTHLVHHVDSTDNSRLPAPVW